MFEKLKKDFASFFNKDIFSSVTSGSQPNEPYQDKSPIQASKTCGVFSPKFNFEQEMTAKSGKNAIEQMKKGTPIKLKNFIKLMHALGFIHVKSRSLAEEEMLTDIWKLLGGTNDN